MAMEILISVILLFVGIVVLVVIHVCIVGRAFNRANNQGVDLVQRSSILGIKRMSNEELNMLPCFDYTAEEKGTATSPGDCAVCLESFKGGEKCRLLPNCKHSFHAQCIDSWLLKTPVCPVCRTCAKTPKIDVSLGGESSVSGDYRIEMT
ncbi:hypothetical protein C1H46_017590 [Malus baccata]|uniref:RING-type E3 ubiquitin transferase n=1 Tax=Malus baccata TaxID=106549 RepID=A0A540MDN9_MALBA|nr:hypothetical protein C1H46_017590 [Malus baccata]